MNPRDGFASCASSLVILDWRLRPITPARDAFRTGWPAGEGCLAKPAPMSASLREEQPKSGRAVRSRIVWIPSSR
jgi:hypothetical protein